MRSFVDMCGYKTAFVEGLEKPFFMTDSSLCKPYRLI
jgi:hypothetical protein